MRKIYRIFIYGEVPSDIKERIAQIHASALSKTGDEGSSACGSKDFRKKKCRGECGRVK